MTEEWIVCDKDIFSGKPIVKGTRISVAIILQAIASGMTIEEILKGYPSLTKEGLFAALEFAAFQMAGEEVKILENA
ncbi:hypothetical protein A3J90_02090 [candidate division WOR-1 bacterium RIFOXYC2_FULL_37_10]|uniref:Antitoxin n=1 Tax=candidate division WOR-1 bacterium RIFOXYB2_FULL_37_13 TaxID=1802579 RepID=A0A1F4SU71_UNCSA|nr:MAG: hypothetical protein A2246_03830 [candidate division WOR-1 bacterium RIFOXYA2_FULL_37_7]OGC23980.1 MAG: hypothetical protein A2310_05480 [candidate division WOR-1 bacterium RIFOXYB2_FULL_37_13]OGC33940.1 MAG: hypothetical protein A3J90_02090 [candidate division WOR-1 bacterium RIFOXYC2_FULL_37_10]